MRRLKSAFDLKNQTRGFVKRDKLDLTRHAVSAHFPCDGYIARRTDVKDTGNYGVVSVRSLVRIVVAAHALFVIRTATTGSCSRHRTIELQRSRASRTGLVQSSFSGADSIKKRTYVHVHARLDVDISPSASADAYAV